MEIGSTSFHCIEDDNAKGASPSENTRKSSGTDPRIYKLVSKPNLSKSLGEPFSPRPNVFQQVIDQDLVVIAQNLFDKNSHLNSEHFYQLYLSPHHFP